MASSIERTTISQVCGHEAAYWESNKRGGPSIVAQLQAAQSRACKACERQTEYEAACLFATEEGLPVISGNSEPQERYAECVRHRVITEWRHQCELYPAGDIESLVLVTRIDAHLESMSDAAVWCGLDTMSGGTSKYPRRVKRTINEIVGIVVGGLMEWPFWTVAAAAESSAVDAALSAAILEPSTQAATVSVSEGCEGGCGPILGAAFFADYGYWCSRECWLRYRREDTATTTPQHGSLMARLAEPVTVTDSIGGQWTSTPQPLPAFAAQAEPQFERIIATVRNC